MTDLPPDLMDVPIPTDGQVASCSHCRAHFDAYFESVNASFDRTAEREHRHPSDVALAYYRIFHMRGHREGPR